MVPGRTGPSPEHHAKGGTVTAVTVPRAFHTCGPCMLVPVWDYQLTQVDRLTGVCILF